MFGTIKTIVMHCLTGPDGTTFDPARVYLAGAVIVFLAGAVVVVIKTHALDFQSFGIGFGALLAGGGLGIAAKSKTEPGEKP
jgi:hypothetical protein